MVIKTTMMDHVGCLAGDPTRLPLVARQGKKHTSSPVNDHAKKGPPAPASTSDSPDLLSFPAPDGLVKKSPENRESNWEKERSEVRSKRKLG